MKKFIRTIAFMSVIGLSTNMIFANNVRLTDTSKSNLEQAFAAPYIANSHYVLNYHDAIVYYIANRIPDKIQSKLTTQNMPADLNPSVVNGIISMQDAILDSKVQSNLDTNNSVYKNTSILYNLNNHLVNDTDNIALKQRVDAQRASIYPATSPGQTSNTVNYVNIQAKGLNYSFPIKGTTVTAMGNNVLYAVLPDIKVNGKYYTTVNKIVEVAEIPSNLTVDVEYIETKEPNKYFTIRPYIVEYYDASLNKTISKEYIPNEATKVTHVAVIPQGYKLKNPQLSSITIDINANTTPVLRFELLNEKEEKKKEEEKKKDNANKKDGKVDIVYVDVDNNEREIEKETKTGLQNGKQSICAKTIKDYEIDRGASRCEEVEVKDGNSTTVTFKMRRLSSRNSNSNDRDYGKYNDPIQDLLNKNKDAIAEAEKKKAEEEALLKKKQEEAAAIAEEAKNDTIVRQRIKSYLRTKPWAKEPILPAEMAIFKDNATPFIKIGEAYLNGIVNPDGTLSFKPNKTLTRAEAVKMIGNVLQNIQVYKPDMPYKDIAGHWAEGDIRKLYNLGIITGGNQKFKPDIQITRGEFANLIAKTILIISDGNTSIDNIAMARKQFVDSKGNSLAYAEFLNYLTVLSGYEDGKFKADRTLTRAEATIMMNKLIQLQINNSVQNKFTDLKEGHWAYYEILSATK